MFEDLMLKKKLNIAQLSKCSGIGYNYVFKIIKNQTDFDRCGIKTAKKLADALGLDLNEIYKYSEEYFHKKIYYIDQSDWDYQMYGELNAELNKLFLIGIEYHFSSNICSRSEEICKLCDFEISCIKYDKLSEATKCIMVAILNQQKKLNDFIKKYKNLEFLINQKPLKEKLYLTNNPYNLFDSYTTMNIEY